MNLELMRIIDRLAAESLCQGRLPPDDALDGVSAVDVWECGSNAAMLFTVGEEADLVDTNEPALHDVYLERGLEGWRAFTGGTLTFENLYEPFVGFSPGLHEICRTSRGAVRLIWAFATPQVALVRLVADGERRDRKPGRGGFVILGMTPDRPITYAHAIDRAGQRLASEPILL